MLQKLRSWLILAVLIIGGPVLIVDSVKTGGQFKRLQAEGRDAVGAVEQIEWSKKRGVERGFKAHVVFKVEDGTERHGEVSVSKEFGQALKDGNAAPVVKLRYLPSDPTIIRAADAKDDSQFMLGAGIVMLLAGAGWLWWKLRSRKAPAAEPAAAT